jgi:hypothetical protein
MGGVLHDDRASVLRCGDQRPGNLILANDNASAIDKFRRDNEVAGTRAGTERGGLTGPEEVKQIEAIWVSYFEEHPPAQYSFGVGQDRIDGNFPVASVAPGSTVSLTFGFVDTVTGQFTTGGPTIGSVIYSVNTDPMNPNVFTPIGTSTNAASHFALSYVLPTGEPDIRATPFDPFGAPIVVTDIDGIGNVAVGDVINIASVPEPSPMVLALVAVSLAVLVCALQRYAPGSPDRPRQAA